MKHRSILLTILFFAFILASPAHVWGRPDMPEVMESDRRLLENALDSALIFTAVRQARLDSMRVAMRTAPSAHAKWHACSNIAEEWVTYNVDSAMSYARMGLKLAERLNDNHKIQMSRMQHVRALSKAGLLSWARSVLAEIDTTGMDQDTMNEYWYTGRAMAASLRVYTMGQRPYHDEADRLYREYDSRLKEGVDLSSIHGRYFNAERLAEDGHLNDAIRDLSAILEQVPVEDNLYGMTAYRLADVYRKKGDDRKYVQYLIRAAVSDLHGSVREGWALPELAQFLYARGELGDAYRYISHAFNDATTASARMRTLEIANALPVIEEAYRLQLKAQRDKAVMFFTMALVLLVMLGVIMAILWREIRRRRESARKLAETSRRQDSYIGNFLALCSSYAERLDSLSKLVARKLSSGQADELLGLLKSGHLDEGGDDRELYELIDEAILDLYPDFVEEVNALLRPEERIEIKEKGAMTSELRIYAMVRLGIEDSSSIARILRYSPTTVYAYRNRMRKRAINRDSFDDDIINMGRECS